MQKAIKDFWLYNNSNFGGNSFAKSNIGMLWKKKGTVHHCTKNATH